MKRREFLGDVSLLIAAGSFPRRAVGQQLAPSCPVTLLPMADYRKDLSREIAAAMEGDGLVLKGKKVLLKPNFVETHPDRPINTNIAVIAGVAGACLSLGAAEVIVGEASGHRRDPWFSVLNPALRDVLDRKVKRVDLNHGDAVAVMNKVGKTGLPLFYVARPVMEADVLISLPKMKTHHWMGVTLSLKNLFGTLPGIYYGWPKNLLHFKGIDRSIVDLAGTLQVHYAIVDGVVGMEGDGPIMGKAKPVGVLVMSRHALAADATAARLMGFDPRKIPYLAQASRFLPGLRAGDIEIRGESPKRFATTFECLEGFRALQGGPFF